MSHKYRKDQQYVIRYKEFLFYRFAIIDVFFSSQSRRRKKRLELYKSLGQEYINSKWEND